MERECAVVFTDLDGCLLPKDYDTHGLARDEADEPYFELYRRYHGPQLLVCTGRSWEATRGIVERAECFANQAMALPHPVAVCEHGAEIVLDIRTGERRPSWELDDRLLHVRQGVGITQDVARHIEPILPQLHGCLEADLGRPLTALVMPVKRYGCTVDVPYDRETGERAPHDALHAALMRHLPESVHLAIASPLVVVGVSRNGVDFLPRVSKGDGVRLLLDLYGRPGGMTAAIGDAESDLGMLEAAELAACPANAESQVRDYVRRRGASGFIAAGSHADGEVEILERLSPGCFS